MDTAWPLVGRDEQLRSIAAAMNEGGAAGVVVAGPAGLGKTRLAAEALRHAEARGRATAWAVATQAAASIPFGPFAHLLSDARAEAVSRLDLLRHASRTLAERARGRPMVLGVDDAHLLDQASAALVHHLVLTASVFVVATVRTGAPAPDAVNALWKDRLAVLLELDPLGREEVAALAETAVGGQLDGATLEQLWRLSQGNALFLRELLTGALHAGALTCTGGLWRATGPLATSTLLAEVVQSRLGQLGADARGVAETVATAEPIGASLLETVVSAGGLEETDRAGMLDVVPDPRRTVVRLAHPLYGELLRGTMTPLRGRLVYRRLAAALQETGAHRREDLLRLALWQLEGGVAADPGLLVGAARHASVSFFDHALAERLAAAAVEAGGGFQARLALAEAWHACGRSREAETLFVELEAQASTRSDQAKVALVRANNLLRGLGESTAAAAVIARAEDRVEDPRWRDEFTVLRATIDVFHGHPRR
ncbi:MAG: AAA family ATPase, partial [Actinomycetota bacterium]|nr:AAA family ATPase [Actinomycetota bacterium]